jgi:4-amino-4-deoxy-L-arabinose transferase-like glycosyltransferase
MVAALLPRVLLALHAQDQILFPDGREFDAIARSLCEHHGYGMQTTRAPVYPTLMATVYALVGPDLVRLRLVEAVLGTVSVGVIGALGAALFGAPAGLLAAAMAALNPVLVVLPSTQYSENTLVLIVALAYAAAFAAWRRGGLVRWVLAGALFGLGLLTRPNVLTLLPGLTLGFALALHRQRRPWALGVLALGLTALLVTTPWVVRNQHLHHHWFFVSTGGGLSFWLGNNPSATGASNVLPPFDQVLYDELAHAPDVVMRERLLYRRGWEFAIQHPHRAAWLYLLRLGNLFALYPNTVTRPSYQNHLSRACQGAASAVLFVGAMLALTRLRRTPALWPLVGSIVTFAVSNAIYFMVMRYRMAFEPCLLWMAGFGWATRLWPRSVGPWSDAGAA